MLHSEAPHVVNKTNFIEVLTLTVIVSVLASIMFNITWIYLEPKVRKLLGAKPETEHAA